MHVGEDANWFYAESIFTKSNYAFFALNYVY